MVDSGEVRGRPDFGLDAPPIVYGYAILGLIGVGLLIAAAVVIHSSVLLGWGLWAVIVGFGVAGPMVYSSKIGKIGVRDRLLNSLQLHGDEDVLDLECGSGLMLLGAAARTPAGTATGIDLWRARDQAGSTRQQCLTNAECLGVSEQVRLVDGDMTDLPFPDGSFNLVLACLAIQTCTPPPAARPPSPKPSGSCVPADSWPSSTSPEPAAICWPPRTLECSTHDDPVTSSASGRPPGSSPPQARSKRHP